MSDARPKLEVVPGGASRDSQSAPGQPETVSPTPSGGRVGHWLWLGLLIVVLVALAFENRRASTLAHEVASLENVVGALESDLSAAEAAVSAHRAHLDDVRAFVSGLSELVARDPEPAP